MSLPTTIKALAMVPIIVVGAVAGAMRVPSVRGLARETYALNVLHLNRLEKVHMLNLESIAAAATAEYGDPVEDTMSEEFPEARELRYSLGLYHEAVVLVWKERIHAITYWSAHADPARDLDWMLDYYGQGHGWDEWSKGYSYRRRDQRRWLSCSIMPALGVQTAEYIDAKNAWKAKQTAP